MNGHNIITPALIARAKKHHACGAAISWLEERPRTFDELINKNADWYLFAYGRTKEIGAWATKERLDWCAERSPWAALEYAAKLLTKEQLDWCAVKKPWAALAYAAKLLTKERLDWCAEKEPWSALAYAAKLLTKEQLEWCRLQLNQKRKAA